MDTDMSEKMYGHVDCTGHVQATLTDDMIDELFFHQAGKTVTGAKAHLMACSMALL